MIQNAVGDSRGDSSKICFFKKPGISNFSQCFAFRISCFFQGKTGHKINIAVGVSATRIDGVFYSLPSSQLTDTFRISASAFNSISDTGRFWPSSKDSAGTLISIPASCVFGKQFHLFHSLRQPRLGNTLADDVTITQLQLSRFPTAHHPYGIIICWRGLDIFGITKY